MTHTATSHLNLKKSEEVTSLEVDNFGERPEIEKIAERIRPYIRKTPIVYDEILSESFQSNLYMKLEILQKTGAFKVRGAFNKMLSATAKERRKGVVAVSGGNHGRAVAYAAKTLDSKAMIMMPEFTPKNYLTETERYGAKIHLLPNLKEAFALAKKYEQEGFLNIHPFDDISVVAGQGTIGLEILEDLPQVTDVIVSVGGGGMFSGVAAVLKKNKPDVRIWGVETQGAESMAKALEANRIIELPKITSIAKTLGVASVGQIAFKLARKYLNGVTVVSDVEAVNEMFYLLDRVKVLTEPAASCTLAAAKKLSENFSRSSHVLLILCGGNIGLDDLIEFWKSRTA